MRRKSMSHLNKISVIETILRYFIIRNTTNFSVLKTKKLNQHLLYFFTILGFYQVQCQIPTLVADLQQPKASVEYLSPQINGYIYYTGYSEATGNELYKTDGTTSTLVKDILPGTLSGIQYQKKVGMANKVFFTANDGVNGVELWVSDGTTLGTTILKDIIPGINGSYPENLTPVGSILFFTIIDGTVQKLYKTDGTALGTVFVQNIILDTNSGDYTFHYNKAGTNLCFLKTDFSTFIELWSSDGTNTTLLKSFQYSFIYQPKEFLNKLYLAANDGINGNELWRTDGTIAGTELFIDLTGDSGSSGVQDFSIIGSQMVFNSGSTLYKTDGTVGGTSDFLTLTAYPSEFNSAGSYVLFHQNKNNRMELWRTDGTAAGTFNLKSYQNSDNNGNYLLAALLPNGTCIFTIDTYENGGQELWKTDGTVANTVFLKDIRAGIYGSNPNDFQILGTNLLFTSNDGINGKEIWKTDGTTGNTLRLTDNLPDLFHSSPSNLTKSNNRLFFTTIINANLYSNLYCYIPSTNSLNSLGTLNSSEFFPFNNKVIYGAYASSQSNQELYISDGTVAGTSLIKDINTGAVSSDPSDFASMGSNVYFSAITAANGRELWKTDGTSVGTSLVKDINAGIVYSDPRNLIALSPTTLLFFTTNAAGFNELYKTDGTSGGTTNIISSPTFSKIYSFSPLAVMGGAAYFVYSNTNNGDYELWKTDGSTISLVKDINTGNTGSFPSQFYVVGSILYFEANNGVNGRELWKTDGTNAGTVMVKDIEPGISNSAISSIFEFNGSIYFSANTALGAELWKSDGTTSGTQLVKDINPSGSSTPKYFCSLNNWLFFNADDGKHKREMWKTDGTQSGTVLVYDYYNDKENNLNSSDPQGLTVINNNIYYAATNGDIGRELFKLNPCISGNIFNPYASGTSHSLGTITPSSFIVILPQHSYNYFSEKSIELKPGFKMSAMAGSENVFRAEIRNCD